MARNLIMIGYPDRLPSQALGMQKALLSQTLWMQQGVPRSLHRQVIYPFLHYFPHLSCLFTLRFDADHMQHLSFPSQICGNRVDLSCGFILR